MTLVLVVDDVAPLAEQYAYDLRRIGGYEVLTAPTGEKALEILASAPVDCVILDLEMPGMDGFEVLRDAGAEGVARCRSSCTPAPATTTAACRRSDSAPTASSTRPSRWSAWCTRSRARWSGAGSGRRIRRFAAARPGDLAGGRKRGHGGAARDDRQGRAGAEPGADRGRERERQGAGRARPAPVRAAAVRAVRRHQLRGAPREPGRERALRPRAGRVHRERSAPGRAPSRRRSGGRCSWTRSASCRSRPRPSCCACWRSGRSPGWAGRSR